MNAIHSGQPVLVGVDGSEGRWPPWTGRSAAATRHSWLRVVHAFIWPLFPHVPLGPSPYGPPDGGLRSVAEGIVDEAVRQAATGSPA